MTDTPDDQSNTLSSGSSGAEPADQQQFTLLLDLVREVNQGASRERVFALVADALREVFGIDRFALVLAHDEEFRLVLSRGLSSAYVDVVREQVAEAAGARALIARKPLYIPDAVSSAEFWPLQDAAQAEGFHTVLILPLFSGSEPIGYLIMYHDEVRVYTPAEIMLAQTLAQQATFAVHHAQLHAETEQRRLEMEQAFQRRVVEAEAIDDIMLQINSSLDLGSTLQSITDAAASLSGADTAAIYLRGPDGQYRAMAAHGVSLEKLQAIVLSASDGLIAQICRTGLPTQVTDFSDEVKTTAEAQQFVAEVGAHATLAVPLMQGIGCMGALYVAAQQSILFPSDTTRTLQRLAAFAQVAVQNAQRFTTVEAERTRLQEYVDAIPDGIAVFDRSGRFVLTNKSLQREFGTHDTLVGVSRLDFVGSPERYGGRPMRFRYNADTIIERILETGNPEEGLLDLENPDQTFEIHFSPLKGSSDRVEGVVATMRDITAPLELERQRSRANLLAQLLTLSAVLNSDLSVTALSERVVDEAMELIGATSGTLGLIEGERLLFRRFHLRNGWVDFDIALRRGQGGPGYVWETVHPYVCNDCAADPRILHHVQQEVGFQQMVCVPLMDRAGKMIGTLSVYDPAIQRDFDQRDVEALQLLGHQVAIAIENARLNETKDVFLSIVSHELKTPITSIKGFAQVLQRRLSAESLLSAGRYLEVINQQTDRLTALINDLLDLSRIQTGRFHFEIGSLDYGLLVHDVVAEMRLMSGQNPIEVTAPRSLIVRGNADRLRQVLVNLIDNAIQHGLADGSIHLSVNIDDAWVTTCVHDEGPGLPPGEEERIFGPYYQVRSESVQPAKGLGLGLYISHQVVDEHGGKIWVDRKNPTTFCFTIPRQ